jgi:hypothetical protein
MQHPSHKSQWLTIQANMQQGNLHREKERGCLVVSWGKLKRRWFAPNRRLMMFAPAKLSESVQDMRYNFKFALGQ